jgi:hypothetical protein
MPNAELITTHAALYGLSPQLVAALVAVESTGNPWAWNPEPRYRYFWNVSLRSPFRKVTDAEIASETPPADFPALAGDPDQEWWAQQASWGLMQVMGAVAREKGLKLPFLTQLCDPAVNLSIGCQHLRSLMVWSDGNPTRALAAYNGGKVGNSMPPYRNASYAIKVLANV